jgi:heme O synthase-like polyprenyltransferase
LALAVAVWQDESDRSAKRMFGYSIFYLFGLFAILIADNTLMTAV